MIRLMIKLNKIPSLLLLGILSSSRLLLIVNCDQLRSRLHTDLSLQIAAGTSLIVLHRIRQIQISASGSLRNQIFIIKWDL